MDEKNLTDCVKKSRIYAWRKKFKKGQCLLREKMK
jgi:hypothetical protein